MIISMLDISKKQYAKWFTRKFLEWQISEDESKTVEDFAVYLGFKRAGISHYLNGRNLPSYSNALKISQMLNDYEGMRILGYPNPGESSDLSTYPPEIRSALAKAVKRVEELEIPANSEQSVQIFIEELSKVGSRVISKTKE